MYFSSILLKTFQYESLVLRQSDLVRKMICSLCLHRTLCSGSEFPTVEEIVSERNRSDCINKMKSYKLISPRQAPASSGKKAAVLVPLCVVDEEIGLLYTLRKADLKRHRGQVSFPGGVQDDTDSSLVETALRETEEELGIDRNTVDIWGASSYIIGMEFIVLPVLGYLGNIDMNKLKPNPDEVELPFVVPLKHFCVQDNCRFTQFRYGKKSYTLPTYINADCRIWGITALITHLILSSLIPKHYNHKVSHIKPVQYSDVVL